MVSSPDGEPSFLPFISGPPERFWGSPEGHVSQEGGQAESGGLCDHLGQTGIDAGTGSYLSGPAHLAEPR